MQTNIAKEQLDIGKQQLALSQQEMDRRKALQQPSIDWFTNLISGDPNARMTAAAAPIGDISRASKAATENIFETTRAGAGRDFALSMVPQQAYSQSADFMNKAYLSAFPGLAGLGTESGQVGLQQTGAGLRGFESGANTNAQVMDQQTKQKQATLGMIGSIAGMAGSAALPSFMQKSGSSVSPGAIAQPLGGSWTPPAWKA